MMAMYTGSRCSPCTTRRVSSHAGLLLGASSSPVGKVLNQLKCTMRSLIGGFGFRAICLTKLPTLAWAARFCRMMVTHAWLRGCMSAITSWVCQPRASLRVAQCRRLRVYRRTLRPLSKNNVYHRAAKCTHPTGSSRRCSKTQQNTTRIDNVALYF